MAVLVQQDVGRLEISVDDIAAVHVVKAENHLCGRENENDI